MHLFYMQILFFSDEDSSTVKCWWTHHIVSFLTSHISYTGRKLCRVIGSFLTFPFVYQKYGKQGYGITMLQNMSCSYSRSVPFIAKLKLKAP